MRCQWCKEEKDETEFHWKWKDIERLKVCKVCRKTQSKRYRDGSLDKRLAYNKKYTELHKEKIVEYGKEYYRANIDNIKRYRADNAEIISVKHAMYRISNLDSIKSNTARWNKEHPDRCQHYNKQHQARVRGAIVSDFTYIQWKEILVECDYRCVYCGKREGELQQDHIQPVSRGGNHTKSNIVSACISCNSSKKDRTLEQWKLTTYYRNNCQNSRI